MRFLIIITLDRGVSTFNNNISGATRAHDELLPWKKPCTILAVGQRKAICGAQRTAHSGFNNPRPATPDPPWIIHFVDGAFSKHVQKLMSHPRPRWTTLR